MEYKYGMRLRGFSVGCQPDGVIRREDSNKYWDIIVYDRELTPNEIYQYDLEPLDLTFTNDELILLSDTILSYMSVLNSYTLTKYASRGLKKDLADIQKLHSKICTMMKGD